MAVKSQEPSVIRIKAVQDKSTLRALIREGTGKYLQRPILRLQFPMAATKAILLSFLRQYSVVYNSDYVRLYRAVRLLYLNISLHKEII
jgi:hypothetical protein